VIKRKPKKCKGTGKAKGSGCGEVKYAHRYGLCASCFKKWMLETKEGAEYLKKVTLKVTAPRIKSEQELKKAFEEKKRRKNLSWYLNDVRTIVHKWVKLRDKGKPCISCGTPWKSDFQAGHFYKAELYSVLRFNFDNIHAQCVQCNIRKEGNLNPYSKNLPLRIGKKRFNELKKIADANYQTAYKWDKEQLKKIRAQASKLIKELKSKMV